MHAFYFLVSWRRIEQAKMRQFEACMGADMGTCMELRTRTYGVGACFQGVNTLLPLAAIGISCA